MAIRVTETLEGQSRTYPIVCKHRDYDTLFVLFTYPGTGVCLSPETHPSYGKLTDDWDTEESVWSPTCVTINSVGIK